MTAVPQAHPCHSLLHRLRQLGLPLGLAAAFGTPWLSAAPGRGETPVSATTPGARGAQVYCFMRSSGNDHQVSWDAAYAVIKRQSDRLFKTSPAHAAVMITETVVQNPDAYPDCNRYLGDLFRKPESIPASTDGGASRNATRNERYNQ